MIAQGVGGVILGMSAAGKGMAQSALLHSLQCRWDCTLATGVDLAYENI